MKLGITPDGKIFIGEVSEDKNGNEIWGEKQDITVEAIKSVFYHLAKKAITEGNHTTGYVVDELGELSAQLYTDEEIEKRELEARDNSAE